MGEEIAFENGRISDFQVLVTLTLDRVILHTVMHHSLTSTTTSTYIPNFIEIEVTFCGRTDGHFRHMGICESRGGNCRTKTYGYVEAEAGLRKCETKQTKECGPFYAT